MQQYERIILNALLDTYENSLLSRGENKVNITISFAFTKKSIPQYFDESSSIYEDIHFAMKFLEEKEFISIVWKRGKENHIIQKVLLNVEQVKDVYRYVKRTPKSEMSSLQLKLLEELTSKCRTPVAVAFVEYLKSRIQQGKSVKEFIELDQVTETRQLISIIMSVEENEKSCYLREFSIQHLSDTKKMETMLGLLGKIMRKFDDRFVEMDVYSILAEYNIYDTPNYVYFKGNAQIGLGNKEENCLELKYLKQGVGISGEDLPFIQWKDVSNVRRVITIENLTTFFRWEEENSILIYLGGYHNFVRRSLLLQIYEQIPEAEYLHFGDIDVGGFEIYQDLCQKTGIPFKTYHMGIEELERYEKYTRPLTENDHKRLDKILMMNVDDVRERYLAVLQYMKKHGRKLEQECIER